MFTESREQVAKQRNRYSELNTNPTHTTQQPWDLMPPEYSSETYQRLRRRQLQSEHHPTVIK